MDEFSYINSYSDKAVLQRIGEFVKQRRIDQNLTQQSLAEKAAISRSTLSLMERGENIALLNLIKVLRMLDALYVLDAFHVERSISPILLAREEHKRRKRAGRNKGYEQNDDLGW